MVQGVSTTLDTNGVFETYRSTPFAFPQARAAV